MRIKALLFAGAAALALGIPALAQQGAQPSPVPAQPIANSIAAATPTTLSSGPGESETSVEQLTADQLGPPPAPVEYPSYARRDPWVVGQIDPATAGLGTEPWGTASGTFLSSLMRRMDTPIASRWAHIALRNGLLAKVRAPRGVNPVDWVAERSWLLLRLGEADAARLLVADIDSDRFTPKMVQVGVQSALANGDPPALCPIEPGIRKYEPGVHALVSAMCASLSGEPESASAQIDDARRHGRVGGIDLTLAEKVVGAGADTGRAVNIEWEPVDRLTAWRFGLATATGMKVPDRLINAASPQLRAFQARSPLFSPRQPLKSAEIATGLGVFSSQSMIDLYSAIYDATDPSDLSQTDAWQVRQAFVGKDRDARVAAIRRLLDAAKDPLPHEGGGALVGRAASLIAPDSDLKADAPELIAAMLAAGYDRAAARWIGTVRTMDGDAADRSWAMLALAAPDPRGLDLAGGRISSFISRDKSPGKVRSSLLVAGLVGLGRIDFGYGGLAQSPLRFGHRPAVELDQDDRRRRRSRPVGQRARPDRNRFPDPELCRPPGSQLYHAVSGLVRTGQDFTARMIAAEALART